MSFLRKDYGLIWYWSKRPIHGADELRCFILLALNTYIPRITDKVDTFLSQITRLSAANPDTGVDASSWTMLLTFDIMGQVGFSKDFRGVETGVEHPAIKCIHDHMTVMGVVSHTPWLLNMIPRIPGAGAGFAPFFKWCRSEVQAKKKVCTLQSTCLVLS